jgi:hypothetical protein
MGCPSEADGMETTTTVLGLAREKTGGGRRSRENGRYGDDLEGKKKKKRREIPSNASP